jgi:hypothetical protein
MEIELCLLHTQNSDFFLNGFTGYALSSIRCVFSVRQKLDFSHIAYNTSRIHGALPWVWPRFDPRSVRVRFVVDEVALGKVFLQALRFSVPVSSASAPYSPSSTVALTTRTNGRSLGTFKSSAAIGNRGELG